MSDDLSTKRTDIYPHNKKKAEDLASVLNMSVAEMVNFLIENVEIEQMTRMIISTKQSTKKVSFTRRTTSYDPNKW